MHPTAINPESLQHRLPLFILSIMFIIHNMRLICSLIILIMLIIKPKELNYTHQKQRCINFCHLTLIFSHGYWWYRTTNAQDYPIKELPVSLYNITLTSGPKLISNNVLFYPLCWTKWAKLQLPKAERKDRVKEGKRSKWHLRRGCVTNRWRRGTAEEMIITAMQLHKRVLTVEPGTGSCLFFCFRKQHLNF